MSKLVDKLKQLSQAIAPSIGFRPASARTQSAAMLLIAHLPRVDTNMAKIVAGVGVDAVLLPKELFGSQEQKQVLPVLKDIPFGVAVGEANLGDMALITESGSDFIVFSLKTPVEILEIKDIGKILEIKPSLDPGLVRAINDLPLPVDGVSIGGDEPYLTIEHFLICRRFSELLDKPVLMTIPSSVSTGQLSSLWETGIDGVVVSGEQPKERLMELKKAISHLPRRLRRRGKVAALLPPLAGETRVEVGEEEI